MSRAEARSMARGLSAEPEAIEISGSSEGSDEEDDDLYVVEKIVDHKINRRIRSFDYRVRWEGYKADDDTWEPHDNIAESASAAVDAYWEPRGGYTKNHHLAYPPSNSKRKAQSTPGSQAASSPVGNKRRRQSARVTEPPNSDSKKTEKATSDIAHSPATPWIPPFELASWEKGPQIETIESDQSTKALYVILKWPEQDKRSRHKTDIIYKKMPQAMLKFYESNIVFKTTG